MEWCRYGPKHPRHRDPFRRPARTSRPWRPRWRLGGRRGAADDDGVVLGYPRHVAVQPGRTQGRSRGFRWPNRDNPVTLPDRMMPRRPPSLGLLLALLALVMQLGFGVPVPRSEADAVLAVATLCHSDDGGGAPSTPHTPDCSLCPLCVAVDGTAFTLPASGPAIPAPRTAALARPAAPPPSTAPPSTTRFTAQPRAPPFEA